MALHRPVESVNPTLSDTVHVTDVNQYADLLQSGAVGTVLTGTGVGSDPAFSSRPYIAGGAEFGDAVNLDDVLVRSALTLVYASAVTVPVAHTDVSVVITDPAVGNATLNADSAGQQGQHVTIIVRNDVTAARTITWGTHFVSTGPLVGVAGQTVALAFVSDGATLYEVGRRALANPMSAQDDLIIGGASGTPARLAKGTDGQVLTVDPTTHHLVWATPAAPGTGTVTSVAMTVPSDLAVSGSPITGAGTLAVTRPNQNANQGLFGPASGAAATPAFRALVDADIPNVMTTQDDLVIGGASGARTRLAKGTDGQVLTVDPTTHHLVWATPASGSGTVTSVSGTAPVSVATGATTPVISVAVAVASGASHAAGLVPDPGSTAGTTKFLREDMTFAVPAGGGGSGAMTAIQTQTVSGSAVASITFSSISIAGTYTHLMLLCQARASGGANGFQTVRLQFNGDTATNYDYILWDSTGAAGATAAAFIGISYIPGGGATANYAGAIQILIPNYAGTTFYKNVLSPFSIQNSLNRSGVHSGTWKSTAAITSISLLLDANNIAIGSVVSLYGIS